MAVRRQGSRGRGKGCGDVTHDEVGVYAETLPQIRRYVLRREKVKILCRPTPPSTKSGWPGAEIID